MSVLPITTAVPSLSCRVKLVPAAHIRTPVTPSLPFCKKFRGCSLQKLTAKATAELAERWKVMSAERLPAQAFDAAAQSRPLLKVKSKEDLFLTLKKEIEAKHAPASAAAALEELFKNYEYAVQESGNPNANEIILANMATVFDRVLLQFEEPFTFSSYHQAIREPFDYYTFGQNYIRPLLDFRNSYVGNLEIFNRIESQLQQGHNVVLISNHQTEADPAVISLLLEKSNPLIAEGIIYVAGDRVVHDPICKPFSMGRNLLCVYSKKHINDEPELADMKKKANARTLKEMAILLRKGGQLIWIAPSGGRDRPDPNTREWVPIREVVSNCERITKFIYGHGILRSLFLRHSKGKEISRPGATRFATHFLSLRSLLDARVPLGFTFISEEWTRNDDFLRLRISIEGVDVASLVKGSHYPFWSTVEEVVKDKFDDSSLENMRRLLEHSGVPGHMHPLSLLCYDVMPPPLQVEKEIGEKRKIGFHGVGMSVAPELKFSDFVASSNDENEAKAAFPKAFYDTVVGHYNVLRSAIYGGKGTDASNDFVELSQPWEVSSGISNQSEQ